MRHVFVANLPGYFRDAEVGGFQQKKIDLKRMINFYCSLYLLIFAYIKRAIMQQSLLIGRGKEVATLRALLVTGEAELVSVEGLAFSIVL